MQVPLVSYKLTSQPSQADAGGGDGLVIIRTPAAKEVVMCADGSISN